MNVNDLLDMTVREVLDEYCVLFSPECCYTYGVTSWDNANQMYDEYNIEEEYPESMCPENLISDEVWDTDEIIDMEKINRIMDNLGISRKGDVDEVQ